ncbi:hypothetical protein CONLIGDRAFT_684731 [Coniochaeta ligniaria NRRL 30616]|uniref:Ecp2 effector protein-like domain-containing protein n=1 Tax=Coniochaeta ligniaria NRRL 30616 TaxID=1408157 RepID=A0A1J7J4S1_9PEZI|nr:hypothetical protein CONLIGDRAFT_684731 [Coniochaeta ligniaria NRRL 30616]
MPVALMALLFVLSLCSPTARVSPQASQALAAPNVPIPDFSTPVNDPKPPRLIASDKDFRPRDSLPTSTNKAAMSDQPAPANTAPIPDFSTPTDDSHPPTFSPGDTIDLCGESTFENQDSAASPLIADCLHIVDNIADGGQWSVTSGSQHQLVQWGTCAFGVQGCCGDAFFYIGNEDIIDIIHDSINKFGFNGIIGAKGRMQCSAAALGAQVEWGLYHTSSKQARSVVASPDDTSFPRPNLPAPTNDTTPIPDFATPVNDTHPALFSASGQVVECGESTFDNQNSAASPKIEDCLHIVENISGGGRWEVEATVHQQHQLVQWGTCAFGVQGGHGDGFFYVGNEDIIYIIQTAIRLYGFDGIIGAKGWMVCKAWSRPPVVSWGIYHTK